MNKTTIFDSTALYAFGKTIPENINDLAPSIYADLSKEEQKILSQVITHAKNALLSRFSDYMYRNDHERAHYKFDLKGGAAEKHREMIKNHHLRPADLPEYMEDMIRKETFVCAEPLCVNKKKKIWNTVFVFRDKVFFEDDQAAEIIELRFTLDMIVKTVYDMTVLVFGTPVKEKSSVPIKEKQTPKDRPRVSCWSR